MEKDKKLLFKDLSLSKNVLNGLDSAGFVHPSPIQAQAIPLGRFGVDIIGQSKSGTGKTCVFVVILLENVNVNDPQLQGLVLAPTREIASQVHHVIMKIGCFIPRLRCVNCIGGLSLLENIREIDPNYHNSKKENQNKDVDYKCEDVTPHIVTGTPGRLQQLMKMGVLKCDTIRTVVLDEADKLLCDEFLEIVTEVLNHLPERRQTLVFSATFTDKMLSERLKKYMRNPQFVNMCKGRHQSTNRHLSNESNSDTSNEFCLKTSKMTKTEGEAVSMKAGENVSLLGVTQYLSIVGENPSLNGPDTGSYTPNHSPNKRSEALFREKIDQVKHILDTTAFYQCTVFCNQRSKAEVLVDVLEQNGWPTGFIAGDLGQKARSSVMLKIRNFEIRVLVSTDLTARGVDLERINLVICLDVPRDAQTYMHRVGRTGRFGSYGVSVSVLTNNEAGKLYSLLRKAYPSLMKQGNTMLRQLPEIIPTTCYANKKLTEDDQKRLTTLELHRQASGERGSSWENGKIADNQDANKTIQGNMKQKDNLEATADVVNGKVEPVDNQNANKTIQGNTKQKDNLESATDSTRTQNSISFTNPGQHGYRGSDQKYSKWLKACSQCEKFRLDDEEFHYQESVLMNQEKEKNEMSSTNSVTDSIPTETRIKTIDSEEYARQYASWLFDNNTSNAQKEGPLRPWL